MSRSRFLFAVFLMSSAAVTFGCGPKHTHDPDPDGGGDGDGDVDASTPTDGGTSTTAFDGFLQRYAELYCEGLVACESGYGALTDAECEHEVLAFLGLSNLRAAVAAGELRFDAARAGICLDLLEDAPGCAYEWSEEYCFEEDTGIVVGTVAVGGACDSDAFELCAPGTRCSAERYSGACGVCESFTSVGIGSPCDYDVDCAPTATQLVYCGYDPVDDRDECMAWANPTEVPAGEDCDLDDVICAVGTECDWNDTGTCVTQPGVGDDCDPEGDIGCAGGGECVEDGGNPLGGICYPLAIARTAGSPCGVVEDDWVWCLESARLECDGDVCVSLGTGTTGDPCDELECAPGFTCSGSTYECVAELANGDECSDGDECASGWCLGPNGNSVCSAASGAAAACAP